MSSSQLTPRFVIFIVVSLITHLMELAAAGLFCHILFQQGELKAPWFSVAAGLVIIPLVALQLVSAVFLLRRKGDASKSLEVTVTAVLHVLQLGFISRHFGILQDSNVSSRKPEVVEMLLLRLGFAITSGCTVTLTQIYLMLSDMIGSRWMWAAYLSEFSLLVAITWALSTFRRSVPEQDFDMILVSWPSTVLRHIWRACELLTRIIALGLFASVYTYWLFLVIGLHWLAMLVCLCIPLMSSLDRDSTISLKRSLYCAMTSFVYIFVFINISTENNVFRYTLYYVIIFLENATLIAIWLVQSSSGSFSSNCKYVYIAAIAFVASLISMIVYYKCFHITTTKIPASCDEEDCDTCKIGVTKEMPSSPPRLDSAENWLNRLPVALYNGEDYKLSTQNSMLDSEHNSSVTVSSLHARLQKKLASVDCGVIEVTSHMGVSDSQEGSLSLADTDSKAYKKKVTKTGKKKGNCTNSESELSSALDIHSIETSSIKRPVWLPSGDSTFANQLLTCSLETFNTADDERSSVETSAHSQINSQSVNRFNNSDSLLCSVLSPREHQWFSDGYSTDHTDVSCVSSGNAWLSEHNSRLHSCMRSSHMDSEVSSIMRPLNLKEQPLRNDLNYNSLDIRSQLLSKIVLNSNPYQSGKHEALIKVDRNKDIPTLTIVHEACTERINNRSQSLSSPASDPSHGPNKKRKKSPKRKSQANISKDKPTSQVKKKNVDNYFPNILPQTDYSCNTSVRGLRLTEGELLAESNKTVMKVNDKLYEITSSASLDPSLTVRVMADKNPTIHSPVSLNDKLTSEEKANKKGSFVSAPKHGIPPEIYSPQSTNENHNCNQVSEPKTSDIASVYENIWQTKKRHSKINHLADRNFIDGLTNVKIMTISSNQNRDVAHVCSESEDSALPPELINSSMDGFTPSDSGSEFSVEIVI